MQVNIKPEDIEGVQKALNGIKSGSKRALSRGINATVKTMNVQARSRLYNELNLKAERIAKDLKTKSATFNVLSGSVIAKGKPVGLVSFGAAVYGKGRRGEGIAVKVKRSGSKSKIKHAFIANGKRGQAHSSDINKHVFFRQIKNGKKVGRYPLETKKGPRIEDIYASDKVFKPIEAQSIHLLAANIDKAVLDVIRRFG